MTLRDPRLLRRAGIELDRSREPLSATFAAGTLALLPPQAPVAPGYVRQQVLALLRIVTDQMQRGLGPDTSTAEQIAALARGWPTAGVPLATAARGVEVAARDTFVEIRSSPQVAELDAEVLAALQDILWDWTLHVNEVLHTVGREQAIVEARRDIATRVRFLRDLSHNRLNPAALREAAELLGLNPDDHYHAIVGVDTAAGRSALEAALRTSGASPHQRVLQIVDRGEHLALVARKPVPPEGVTVGVGPLMPLVDVASSFADARSALRAATNLGIQGAVDLLCLGPLALVEAGDRMARQLNSHYFRELPTGFEEVERTVREYLARDQNVDATARVLNIHRNTVRQRVGRFSAATGLDLRRTRDLVATWWLLSWRQATGAGER